MTACRSRSAGVARGMGAAWLAWALLLLGLVVLSGCSLPRAHDSALVLADLAAVEKPSRLKKTTADSTRAPVSYRIEGRPRAADLYRPGEGRPRAGLVLVPGAVPEGRNEPRIVALATTLARAGFAVLVPDLPGFAELALHPRDARAVADAFAWLMAQPELAPEGRAGMVAISYATGPALLAALAPDIRERVRFILGLGGYYDLRRTLLFLTTGWYEEQGRWRALEPNPYGQLVLARSALPYLASARDRALLEAMVQRRLADRVAAVGDLAAGLDPEGRAVHVFVSNRDRGRFDALFEALPAAMKRDLEGLDVARQDLAGLAARLILVHDREDALIPYTESLALAAAAGPERARVFLIHRILGHVDLSLGHVLTWRFWSEELPDVWRLGRAIYLLLGERADE